MTDTSDHWIHRCLESTKAWLLENPRSSLSTEAFDTVVGAGALPVRDDHSGEYYLHPDDQEYLIELRRAGETDQPR